jgi:hypothetical protein
MRTIILAQLFVISALIWYCGYLKSAVDAGVSQSAALRQSNNDIKDALRSAAYTHVWNHQTLKELYKSDLAIESKQRRAIMAAIVNIYGMNGEYKISGIDSPYAETFLDDLRAEYQELERAEGMLEDGDFLEVPSNRMLVLPTGEKIKVNSDD